MTTTHATTFDLAEQFWAADLACQRANEQIWASGLELEDTDPRVVHALDLGDQCHDLIAALARRAGTSIWIDLADLATDTPLDPETVTAAAVLRVITSDSYITDAENLQPGRELPAVGFWAQLTG